MNSALSVSVKGKVGRLRELKLVAYIKAHIRKKEAYVKYTQMGSSKFLEEYKKCNSIKREIRKVKKRT